jgi:hypothetical protein
VASKLNAGRTPVLRHCHINSDAGKFSPKIRWWLTGSDRPGICPLAAAEEWCTRWGLRQVHGVCASSAIRARKPRCRMSHDPRGVIGHRRESTGKRGVDVGISGVLRHIVDRRRTDRQIITLPCQLAWHRNCAGSVLLSDVPPAVIADGIPARVIGVRKSMEQGIR